MKRQLLSTQNIILYLIIIILTIVTVFAVKTYISNDTTTAKPIKDDDSDSDEEKEEPFANPSQQPYKDEAKYKKQLNITAARFESMGDGKRPVTEILSNEEIIPDYQQCLVNFNALGCRFTGYIGPFEEGYYDPEKAVLYAVKAGCRCFVLEIDYMDSCEGETTKFYPRLVVRDAQGKMRIKPSSSKPLCNSASHSSIKDVCNYIKEFGFSNAAQNSTDPIIIVLYFLRAPPGGYKSKQVLDYYSNVAKSLSPLMNYTVQNELDGGTFYRQKQQGRLLINKISDYNNKVLIFSNANTSGFRDVQTYSPSEDLDYLINLRLAYTQTKLGITEDNSGEIFGILQTAEDYMQIPVDRADDIVDSTKLRWTICLSRDPSKPVTKEVYNKITKTYGVHCIPIQLFDSSNDFMFEEKTFKKYSFIPKPEKLRYIKPPVVIPGEPNPNTDAKQGKLRAPKLGK